MRGIHAFNFFVAFAFTVMADPVSSVAYAIEAALVELDGDLADLLPTMGLVVATIAIVAGTYHQLVRRFPRGGGGPRSVAAAFGEGWAFLPLAALLVDFTLTVAISAAAAASAVIAYAPELAPGRLAIAIGLATLVGAGICLGHRGRVVFATATLFFLLSALFVLGEAVGGSPDAAQGAAPFADAELLPVLLAMPLGMALATGVESPSDAVAQLARLDDRGRRIFGQLTIWLLVAIVGGLTLALSALAVGLGVGLPGDDSTLLAEIGREVTGGGAVFAFFQATSALLLLAAAASAYAAASGLLKALSRGGSGIGLLPRRLAAVNSAYVPFWGVLVVLAAAAVLLAAAGGRDQEIVHYYAVAVFVSFLGAIAGCARLSHRDRNYGALAVNACGFVLVAFVLALNLIRLPGLIAVGATVAIAFALWRIWVAHGRPTGVAGATAN